MMTHPDAEGHAQLACDEVAAGLALVNDLLTHTVAIWETDEDAMDDDNPKAALIALVVSCAGSGGNSGEVELRQELEAMRLKELRARARSEECDDGAMAEAMDSDDPKAAFVQLLLEQARR